MLTEPIVVPGSETQNGTTPPTETVNKPPAPGVTPGAPTETYTSPKTLDEAIKEVESLRAALHKTNEEAKGHRLKAKELDDLKAQLEQQSLSEKEKLERKLADLQKTHADELRKNQEVVLRYEMQTIATTLGIINPAIALRLVDMDKIEYDDSGHPTNVKKLLEAVLKENPYLVQRNAPTSGGATNPSRSVSGAEPLSRAVLAKMTRDEYLERQPEIQAWLRAQSR